MLEVLFPQSFAARWPEKWDSEISMLPLQEILKELMKTLA